MTELDLHPDENTEKEALHLKGEQLWRKSKRYENKQQIQKVRQGLYRQGFSIDMINQYLDQKNKE